MICDNCAAELRYIALEIYQIFRLLPCVNIIEVNVFVAPLKVVNYTLVSQFLLQNENVLEEVQDALLNVEVIEFSNHSLLVLQISLVLIDQSISLINHTSNVIEY
jgi:hypothetical protein